MMNKVFTTTIACIMLIAGYAQKKEVLSPYKSVGKVFLEGKGTYTYYALSEKSRTSYTVRGPGKLELSVRVRADEGVFKSNPFKIRYVRSDKFVEVMQVPELLAGNLKFKSKELKGSPTKAHKLIIDVPPGRHTYSIYKYKTDQKVHLRAFYTQYQKPSWEQVKPSNSPEKKVIRYIKSGTEREYYKVTKQNAFTFDVKDSTSLKVIVRPEFTYSMLDETILKLKLENLSSGEKKIYKLNSKRSNKLEFTVDKQNTPGTSSTFYIKLKEPLAPSETYAFTVLGGAKAALIKLSKDKNIVVQ